MAKSWSSRAWTNAFLWGRDFKYTSPSINSCKILQIPWTSRPTAHWNQAIRPHPSTHFSTPCVPTISNNFQPQPGYAGLLPLNSCGIWGVRYSWRCGVVFGSPSKAPPQSIPFWQTPGFMMWEPPGFKICRLRWTSLKSKLKMSPRYVVQLLSGPTDRGVCATQSSYQASNRIGPHPCWRPNSTCSNSLKSIQNPTWSAAASEMLNCVLRVPHSNNPVQ